MIGSFLVLWVCAVTKWRNTKIKKTLNTGVAHTLKVLQSPWIFKKNRGFESRWKYQSVLESPWISVLTLSDPDSQVPERNKHRKTFRIKLLMLWKNWRKGTKPFNNTHVTKQNWTNNGFFNTKKHWNGCSWRIEEYSKQNNLCTHSMDKIWTDISWWLILSLVSLLFSNFVACV